MSTQLRFLLAMLLMLGVLVGTNLLFPPVTPEPELLPDSAVATAPPTVGPPPDARAVVPNAPGAPAAQPGAATDVAAEEIVEVDSPLYHLEFSTYGARLLSAELPQFQALNRDGVVDLVPPGGASYLSQRLVVGSDTVDLSRAPFEVESEELTLQEGDAPQSLRFVYQHPTGSLRFEVAYTFDPALYVIGIEGRVSGVDRPLLLTDLGEGLAFAEADSANEARMMAYVYNHLDEGIRSIPLLRAEPGIVQGPLVWAAFRNKFFVMAMLAGSSDATATGADYIGGLMVRPGSLPQRVAVSAAQGIGTDGAFQYRLVLGPQDHASLASLGQDLEEVNPYGWRFFRPVVRPIVSLILAVLVFLHSNLSIGYGWVLIVFGIAMRIVLFPLNQKAMKAQLRNMEFQPRLAEAQRKYKDNPQKMQEEVKKLYKEGFNPLAGCLPILLPWPVLIALFFVFQNTIELRGVPFLWLPDLSTKDPLYILPGVLALSMFTMQWLNMRSVDQTNPQTQMQMKMMMWVLPPFMLLIFINLASGLNLYYVVSNLATIPQQMWITEQRKKMRAQSGAAVTNAKA
ncbi:MAG: membrane protein insertase YidC [Gemmatimonadales bacterium]